MIRKNSEFKRETREKMRGGNGEIHISHLLAPDELLGHGRMYAELEFAPGCSIGEHPHENEAEIFYVLNGEITVTDNGEQRVLREGDVMVTSDGAHSAANLTDKPAKLLALIINGKNK